VHRQYLQYIYIATLFPIVPVQARLLNALRTNAHNNSLSFNDKDDFLPVCYSQHYSVIYIDNNEVGGLWCL
jgi:hypothetical protein